MTSYRPVPNDEAAVHERDTDGAGPDRNPAGTSKDAKQYILVSEQDDAQSLQSRYSLRQLQGRCINTFLLASLALFFASCAITIGLLHHYSELNHGLTDERSSRRYAWLYGPTAVVVLLRVIWRTIDLKVKQTTPWSELAHGPSPGKVTILLDYIGSATVLNFWKSFKLRHWPVLITLSGQLILLLMLVFITGLFSLETTLVSRNEVPLRRNHFNASAFNASTIDSSAALLNLAIQTQNLSFPPGTTLDTLVPVFDAETSVENNATIESVLDGVKFTTECELLGVHNASAKQLPWKSIRAPQFLVNVTTPSCNMTNVWIGSGPNHGGMVDRNSTQTFMGAMDDYPCNTGLDLSLPWGRRDLGNFHNDTTYLKSLDRSVDRRMIVSVVDFHYVSGSGVADMPIMWVHNLTTLLCKPSYVLNHYRVSHQTNSSSTQIELLGTNNNHLEDFFAGDISTSITNMFHNNRDLFIGYGGSDYKFSFNPQDPFLQAILMLHGGESQNFTLGKLLDPDLLKEGAESIISGTMTQAFRRFAMTDLQDTQTSDLNGTVTYYADRLHVKALSTGVLCACFAIMAMFAAALLFIAPRKPLLERAVGSLGAVVVALRQSREPSMFCDTHSDGVAREYMTKQTSEADPPNLEYIDPKEKLESHMATGPGTTDEVKTADGWWHPATSRMWYLGVLVALCVPIIGLLEWIQQISDKRDGFVNIDPKSVGTAVLSQYIPAAVVVGLTLMFADVEMLIATFAPFQVPAKGTVRASRVLTPDYLTNSGPHVLYIAILNRSIGLVLIILVTFVGSFLAIVIPALYSQQSIATMTSMTLLTTDQFNFTKVDMSLDDKQAGAILNLQTYYDIDYPIWTYDDLVFPRLEPMDLGAKLDQNDSSSTLTAKVTGYRANLDCQPLPVPINWTVPLENYGGSTSLRVDPYFPWSLCSNPPQDMASNATGPTLRGIFSIFLDDLQLVERGMNVVGQARLLGWDRDYVYMESGQPMNSISAPTRLVLPEWGCPSLMFTLGTITWRNDTKNGTQRASSLWDPDLHTTICTQRLQKVEANVTLSYPSMLISKESPPVVLEDTAIWLQNPSDAHGTAFQFAITGMLRSLNKPKSNDTDAWASDETVDRFTKAAAYIANEEDNLQLSDLLGAKGSSAYLNVVRKLYGRYMAQAISNNMRVSVEANLPVLSSTNVPWSATASAIIVESPSPSQRIVNITRTVTGTIRTASSHALSSNSKLLTAAVTRTVSPSRAPTPAAAAAARRAVVSSSSMLPALLTQSAEGAHVRLRQNRGPKIALQVMFAFMALGAIAARLLTRTKEVLQREPYSIAGRAALVTDPSLLEALNEDSKSTGVEGVGGSDRRYRLDWGEDEQGRKRYGICIAK